MNLQKNNALRAIIYIFLFAGTLKLIALAFQWGWNNLLRERYGLEYLTFLESVGILAFIYLIYAGIKFGFENIGINDNNKPGLMKECLSCQLKPEGTPSNQSAKNKLSAEEKELLSQYIAKCCGMKHESKPRLKAQANGTSHQKSIN